MRTNKKYTYDSTFLPDYNPYQIFKQGAFQDVGGYFRPVYSTIAKRIIEDDYKQFDWGDLPLDKLICEPDATKNKYGVGASLPLIDWERNGWIHCTGSNTSYRGWLGWYCLYYSGERNPKVDEIQIRRWLSVKARFGSMKNKTPKIRQLLLNWAIKSD